MGDLGAAISIGVKTTQKWVRIILVDGRAGNICRRVEMLGQLDIPVTVYYGKVFTNWAFDELRKPCKGVACDIQPEGCTLVFPFVDIEDAMDLNGKQLSLDDLKGLFLKYHPQMKIMKEA